ncbi:MAG: hypothetical protein QGI83_06775, partial [Candidatus Latescibacteria bacterium]|nr:hypothetical protein [Candidatus Latescibacterota bacterium]
MRVSLFSQSLFALSLDQAIDAAVTAGYRALELACTAPHLDLAAARADADGYSRRLESAGLAVSALSLFSHLTGPEPAAAGLEDAVEFVRLAPV